MSFVRIKSLLKDSTLYGISGIITRMITIFLVPIYTRIFLPADYGVINLINSTIFLVSMFSVCALDNAAARWYYDTTDPEDQKRTFASWFWYQFGLSAVFMGFMILAEPIIIEKLFEIKNDESRTAWFLASAILVTNILPNLINNWFRLQRKPVATILYSLSLSLLTIGLTILFVVYLKWHIIGVFAALVISNLVFSLVAITQLYSWLSIKRFSKHRIKEMLRFSLPMIPAALAFWLLNSTDAYFILYFRDKTEVGLFSIGASLAGGVALFTGAFQQAWGPFAFSIINEPDAKQTYANVFLAFGMASSILVLGMFLFSPEILMLLTTSNYYDAAWVASILGINLVIMAFTYIASIGASIAKNTTHYAFGVMVAAVFTIILDILLIPVWGKEGSAIATVLAQLFVPAYLFSRSQKLYPIPYKFGRVVIYMGVAIIIGVAIRMVAPENIVSLLLLKISALLFFSLIVFLGFKKDLKGTYGNLAVQN
jgi:O-antigen/teichoic acid export membrane protein